MAFKLLCSKFELPYDQTILKNMLLILILLSYFIECHSIIRNCEKKSIISVWNINYLPAYRFSEKLETIALGSSHRTIKYKIPSYAYGNVLVEIKWLSPIYGTLFCITIEENL